MRHLKRTVWSTATFWKLADEMREGMSMRSKEAHKCSICNPSFCFLITMHQQLGLAFHFSFRWDAKSKVATVNWFVYRQCSSRGYHVLLLLWEVWWLVSVCVSLRGTLVDYLCSAWRQSILNVAALSSCQLRWTLENWCLFWAHQNSNVSHNPVHHAIFTQLLLSFQLPCLYQGWVRGCFQILCLRGFKSDTVLVQSRKFCTLSV